MLPSDGIHPSDPTWRCQMGRRGLDRLQRLEIRLDRLLVLEWIWKLVFEWITCRMT